MPLSASCVGLQGELHAAGWISTSLLDPECQTPEMNAFQQLETERAVPDDWFSYPAPRNIDIPVLCCKHFWPYETSNTRLSVSHKVFSRQGTEDKIVHKAHYECEK